MMFFYVLVILGILACSASQLWLKRSAVTRKTSLLRSMFSIRVILPYVIFGISLIINIAAMHHGMELKQLPILESLGYIFTPILAAMFLSERVNKTETLGIALIVFGVIVFHL